MGVCHKGEGSGVTRCCWISGQINQCKGNTTMTDDNVLELNDPEQNGRLQAVLREGALWQFRN